jgi:hypothetical protein
MEAFACFVRVREISPTHQLIITLSDLSNATSNGVRARMRGDYLIDKL